MDILNFKTFFQAILFGIVIVLLGLLLSYVFKPYKVELPPDCDKWDDNYIMEITLFTIGFIMRYALKYPVIAMYLNSD
jgi:heme/copper-type cytochrome/quinol oxidase subunit 2